MADAPEGPPPPGPPFARALAGGRALVERELERIGADEAARLEFALRADRVVVAVSGLTPGLAAALAAAVQRQQGQAVRSAAAREDGPIEALVAGPAILLREAVKDLPPDLGRALGRAIDVFHGLPPAPRVLLHARGALDLSRPAVLGVLNVTPDSFSDGGRFLAAAGAPVDVVAALEAARRLCDDGAAALDVGGESTRPGAPPVPVDEEMRRVVPVVRALVEAGAPVPISIDTRRPEVAAAALAAGAAIVNDVTALADPRMVEVVARAGAGAILMHMKGTPETMQAHAVYDDLLREVAADLERALARAEAGGVRPGALAVDPGLGFAKTAEHNLALLRRLPELAVLGRPIVVGASRKSFIGKLTGRDAPEDRVAGSVAAAAMAVAHGASIVRAHDVRATVDAIAVAAALGG